MKELIILTKKWGRNYTGATLATQCFVEHWSYNFKRITVFTLQKGICDTSEIVSVNVVKNESELLKKLNGYVVKSKEMPVGYSDDHLGYLLAKVNIPYIHTYHGNWPSARWIDISFFLKSFYFISLYKKTIAKAKTVVNVSYYMETFTKKYNSQSIVIRNGIDNKPAICKEIWTKTFVMVGNIDSRKYRYAISLAKKLQEIDDEIKIHIYGKFFDEKVNSQLEKCSNVELKGQCSVIPYKGYCGLINTSIIENLSISVCEAILNGIPVFCFNVGGLSEVVVDEKTGWVFKSKDIASMAQVIAKYANSQKKLKVDSLLLRDFDWNKSARKYEGLFEDLENQKEVKL